MTRRFVAAVLLLAAAVGSGAWLQARREAAGIAVSPARVPLGGFEPIAVDLLWLRAETLRTEGRLAEAAAAYRLVTELQPRVADAWTHPAWLLAWTDARCGDPEREWAAVARAVAMLDRGLRLNPDHPRILLTLGEVWMVRVSWEPEIYPVARAHLGHYPEEEGIRVFERYGEVGSSLAAGPIADLLTRLGERRAEDGDRAGAIRDLRRALGIWRILSARPDGEGAGREGDRVEGLLRGLGAR